MSNRRGILRQHWTALRILLVMTVVLGILYPLLIAGVGQAAFHSQANGSLVDLRGTPVGSALIGQSFTDKKGKALPQWFQSRPSAVGYDGGNSGGSNYGPENATLAAGIRERQASIAKLDGVDVSQIPPDAVTASASGLDPHISPAYALLQVAAVAKARGLSESSVRALVESMIQGRDLGYLGEPTINVLELNIALAEMSTR